MKRLLQWMIAATLICGTTVFTACSSGDDNENKPPVVQPDQPDDNGANTGEGGEGDNTLKDVGGNVDINNGGGGVNDVR